MVAIGVIVRRECGGCIRSPVGWGWTFGPGSDRDRDRDRDRVEAVRPPDSAIGEAGDVGGKTSERAWSTAPVKVVMGIGWWCPSRLMLIGDRSEAVFLGPERAEGRAVGSAEKWRRAEGGRCWGHGDKGAAPA
jgi:hypothetical protein